MMQKKCIRHVCKKGYQEHSTPLFNSLHALKFFDIIELKSKEIAYKAYNNMLPSNVQKCFTQASHRYVYRRPLNFTQCYHRTNMRALITIEQSKKLWNTCPETLKEMNNYYAFKKNYKKLLYNRYIVEI
jgi:hypothetical protein